MRSKVVKSIVAIMLGAFLITGCGAPDIAETVDVTEIIEDAENAEEEARKALLMEQPWLAYEKTENVNPDMENITPWDVVNDMRIGWNLGNTLDSTNENALYIEKPFKFETAWGNPTTKKEMIDDVLAAGFNVIRVPVTWYGHIDKDYQIVEVWMDRVQEVVDYAYSQGAYVILNVHHETWNYPYYDNQEQACTIERVLWAQIAERFKDYDEHLIFEAQNEPRKVGTAVEWGNGDEEGREVVNAVNAACVEAVRNSGGSNLYRMIMLPDYAASSSTAALEAWTAPEGDDRIIVSVHAYTPYEFALAPDSQCKLNWNNDTAGIDALMRDLKRLFIDNGYPVIIGEFGAVSRDEEERRLEWVNYYLTSANEINVPCVLWDNNSFTGSGEKIGCYNRKTYTWEFPEYLQAMMEATACRADEDAFLFNAEEYRAMLEAQRAEEEAAEAEAAAEAEEADEASEEAEGEE